MLPIDLRHDRSSAAERLVAEINRAAGFDRINSMVVDDLNDLCGLDTVRRLPALVMIDKDHLLLFDIQQVAL